MHAAYRKHEITIVRMPAAIYFIVLYPNGAKMVDGFFNLCDSLRAKYSELRERIDVELLGE